MYPEVMVRTLGWAWYSECVCDCSLTSERRASDKCQREKRKTINGDDLLWAMSTLGFEDYVEPLKVYLHKYREVL
jgi:nuclear transcription Y subunit beta